MFSDCATCGGTGEVDPFEAHGGFPPFTECRCCLGAGLETCSSCDGLGVAPVAAPCAACGSEVDQLRAA